MKSKSQNDRPIKNTSDANDDDNCTEQMDIGIEENVGATNTTVNNEILTSANFVPKEFSICLGPPINFKHLVAYRKYVSPAENDFAKLENPKRMRHNTSDDNIFHSLSTSSYPTLSCTTTPGQFIGPFDYKCLVSPEESENADKNIGKLNVHKKNSKKLSHMAFNRFLYYSNKLISESQIKQLYKSIDIDFSPNWERPLCLQCNSRKVSTALVQKIKLLQKAYEHMKFRKLFDGMKMSLKKLLTYNRNLYLNSNTKSNLVKCYQKLSKYYFKIMKLFYKSFQNRSSLLEQRHRKKSMRCVINKCKKNYPNNNTTRKNTRWKKRIIIYFINNIISPVFVASTYYYYAHYSNNLNMTSEQIQTNPITESTDVTKNKSLANIEFVTNVIPTNINDNIVKKIKKNGKVTYNDVTATLRTYERALKIEFTDQQTTRMANNFYGFYNHNKRSGSKTVTGDNANEDSDADDNNPLDYFELVDSDVDMSEDFSDVPSTSANQTATDTYTDFIGHNSTRSSVTRRKNDAENKLINENKTKLVEKCYDYFFNVNFLKMISRPQNKFNCVDNVFEMVYNGRDLNNAHGVSGKIETITKSLSSYSPVIRFNKTNAIKNIIGNDINNFDMLYYYTCQRSLPNKIDITDTSILNDNTVITEIGSEKKYAEKVTENSAVIHHGKPSTSTETTTLIDFETPCCSSSLNSTHRSDSEKNTIVLKECEVKLIDVYYYVNKNRHEVVMDEVHYENPTTSMEPITPINVENLNSTVSINSTVSSGLEQEATVFERSEVSVRDNNNFTSEITNEVITDEVHNRLSDEVNDTPLNDNTTLAENDFQQNNLDRTIENNYTFDNIIDYVSTSTLTDIISLIDVENSISNETYTDNVEEEETNLNNSISEVINDILMYGVVNNRRETDYLNNNKLEMEMNENFPPGSSKGESRDGRNTDRSNNMSDVMNEVAVVPEDVNDNVVDDNFDGQNLETEVDTLPDGPHHNETIVVENAFIESTSGNVDENAANFQDINQQENSNRVNSINSIIPNVSTYSTNSDALSNHFMEIESNQNIVAHNTYGMEITNEMESENADDIETGLENRLDEIISNVVATDHFFDDDEQLGIEIHDVLSSDLNIFADVGDLSVLNDENLVVGRSNDIGSDFNNSMIDEDGILVKDYVEVNVESEDEEENEIITVGFDDIDRLSPMHDNDYRLHDYLETIDLTNDDDDNEDQTDLRYMPNSSKEDNCKVVLSQVQENDTYERFVSMYSNDINMLASKLRQAGIGIPIAKEDIAASRMTVTFTRTCKKWFEKNDSQDADVVCDRLVMDVLKNMVQYMKKKDIQTIGRVDKFKMTIAINITFEILNEDQCFAEEPIIQAYSSSFFFSGVPQNDDTLETASQNEMVNLLNGEKFDVTFSDWNSGGVLSTNVCTIMINEILNMNMHNNMQVQIKMGDDETTYKHMMFYTADEANDGLSTADDDPFIVNEMSIADDPFVIGELSAQDNMDVDCFDNMVRSFDDLSTGFDNAGSLLFL